MNKSSRLRFTKTRNVKSPNRNNEGDAGLDFYIPEDLTFLQLALANKDNGIHFETKSEKLYNTPTGSLLNNDDFTVTCIVDGMGVVKRIYLAPSARVLIPSGIRVLLEPKDSMLTAANKSGLATKQGLIFTAQVVDTPYTGEIHIGVVNTGVGAWLEAGKKATQFIHVPVYLTDPEEISNDEYHYQAANWDTTRGNNGFGSGDK